MVQCHLYLLPETSVAFLLAVVCKTCHSSGSCIAVLDAVWAEALPCTWFKAAVCCFAHAAL